MSDPNLYERQRTALRELVALIEERTQSETNVQDAYKTGRDSADREIHKSRKTITASREKELGEIETAFTDEKQDLTSRFEATRDRLQSEQEESARVIGIDADNARYEAKSKYKDALWTLDSLREASEKRAEDHLETARRKIAAGRERMVGMWEDVEPRIERFGYSRAELEPGEDHEIIPTDTLRDLETCLAKAESLRRKIIGMRGQSLAVKNGIVLFLIPALGVGSIAGVLGFANRNPSALQQLIIGLVVGAVVGIVGWLLLRNRVKTRMRQLGHEFAVAIAQSEDMAQLLDLSKQARYDEIMKEIGEKHDSERTRADGMFKPMLANLEKKRINDVASNTAKYRKLIDDNRSAC